MKKRTLIILFSTAMILASCGSEGTKEQSTNTVQVNVENTKLSERFAEYQFSGKVKADDKTILSTKIIGQVEQVLVKEGASVKKGQLLVKIKSLDLSTKRSTALSGLKTAKINMENTNKNYNRIKSLHEKGSATQKELEDMTAAKEAAITQHKEAMYRLAEINDYMSYANLTSPINGFVSKKMVNVGDMAKPGHPVLALESLDELKIEIAVPEFEISRFDINDEVFINIDAVNAKNIKGNVERIIPSSTFSGQYKVIAALNKKDNRLKPGMFSKVTLLKGKTSKLLVAKESIIHQGQLTGLYTVNQQSEAMLRWVRLGKDYGDQIEVVSGLKPGEQLIVSSTSKLTDGTKVKTAKIK